MIAVAYLSETSRLVSTQCFTNFGPSEGAWPNFGLLAIAAMSG